MLIFAPIGAVPRLPDQVVDGAGSDNIAPNFILALYNAYKGTNYLFHYWKPPVSFSFNRKMQKVKVASHYSQEKLINKKKANGDGSSSFAMSSMCLYALKT
jgi:hypothetical protein